MDLNELSLSRIEIDAKARETRLAIERLHFPFFLPRGTGRWVSHRTKPRRRPQN